MYEQAAMDLEQAVKSELGENYTTEDLIRLQMEKGLITPKTTAEFNIRNEVARMKSENEALPPDQQRSFRKIADELAVRHNCSITRIHDIAKKV